MGKAKKQPTSPFEGCWHIVSMTTWDEGSFNEEVQAFFDFDVESMGEFQVGYVRGGMDCRVTTRDGKPVIEWTWDGNDELAHVTGRGWAVLQGDELHGVIFIHLGDDSAFVAHRAQGHKRARRK